ncbi:MAG: HyaD/HybD family hydrogenase maturation endopeptidase [Bryobacteraceae bacterium]|jgi:hydrogenase maturation protease
MIAVLGLGNLVHSDDGVGIHAIQHLKRDPRVAPDIMLLDGGTQGLSLASHISGFQRLLVIDAVDAGQLPGTLMRFESDALEGLPGKPSVHQLGFADLMIALKLLEESPEQVVVIGIQPLSTEWSAELTAPVRDALPALLDAVIGQLEMWNSSGSFIGSVGVVNRPDPSAIDRQSAAGCFHVEAP